MTTNVLIAGQSNASGRGTRTPYANRLSDNIEMWNDEWLPAQEPANFFYEPSKAASSMVVALGNEIYRLTNNEPVKIVITAVGGTGLVNQEWSLRTAQSLYQTSVNRCVAASIVPDVIVWFQGESDNASTKEDYLSELTKLITDYRTDFNKSDIKFVVIQLGKINGHMDSHIGVREAQAEIADNILNFTVTGLQSLQMMDTAHYNTLELNTIGEWAAQTYVLGEKIIEENDIVYKQRHDLLWVMINGFWWTVNNYNKLKLDDGTDIPLVTDDETWTTTTQPAYCYPNNTEDETIQNLYGPLYNGYARAGLKLPVGCFTPGYFDWLNLADFLIANGYNWDHDPPNNESLVENRIGKAVSSNEGLYTSSAIVGRIGNNQIDNNRSGLNIRPAGNRAPSSGDFLHFGDRGFLHTTGQIMFFTRSVNENFGNFNATSAIVRYGGSVRLACVARKVTFSTNGGTAIDDEFWFDQDTIEAPAPPTKEGFNFAGWYSDEALTTEWDFATDTVDADTTLFAKWAEVPVINGDVQSGPASITASIKPMAIITAVVQSGAASVSASVKPIATLIGSIISGSATVTATAKTVVKIIGSVQSGVASVTARIFPFVEMKTSELRIFTVPFKSRIFTKKRR